VRRWFGGSCAKLPKRLPSRRWLLTTFAALVRGFATQPVGSLSKSSFCLGIARVETTERYLGSRQRISHAVNDKLGIEPDAPSG
jgi:hypothetical protein